MKRIGFLSFVATVGMFMSLPSQFFPTTNSDFSRVRIEMLPGTTITQTEAVADKVADIINAQPETLHALESIREGNAFIFITLKKDRERTSIEYERELTPQLAQVADARVSFLSQSGGGGTGRARSNLRTVCLHQGPNRTGQGAPGARSRMVRRRCTCGARGQRGLFVGESSVCGRRPIHCQPSEATI